jgi:hypothetical protein
MNWRSKKLLDAAKDAPVCMGCGKQNNGEVVMAHSNQLRDGKGTGIKAHDYRVAAMCNDCHYEIDNGTWLSREQRVDKWEEAHRKTIGWLIESGRVTVSA